MAKLFWPCVFLGELLVTHIALILAIQIVGLLFGLYLARRSAVAELALPETLRLYRALIQATTSFLRRGYRLSAIAVVAPAIMLVLLHASLSPSSSMVSGAEAALWSTLALILGALSVCLAVQFSTGSALRASARLTGAAGNSLDESLTVCMRTGGAVGLVCESLSALGLAALCGLVYAAKGGFANAAAPETLLLSIGALSPVFALGSATAALVLQRAGSTYKVVGESGYELGGEKLLGIGPYHPKNPAVVSRLAGDHLGDTLQGAADLCVTAAAANSLALLLGTSVLHSQADGNVLLRAALLLPLLVRGFGLLATGFGVMVVRTDGEQAPQDALWRGLATTSIIAVGGVAGGCIWCLGSQHALPFVVSGALGVLVGIGVGQLGRFPLARRFKPLRELLESLKVDSAITFGTGLGTALKSAALPLLGAALTLALSWSLGENTGLKLGGVLCCVTTLMAMLAVAPFALGLSAFGAIATNAKGMVAMNSSRSAAGIPADAPRRALRLDEAGLHASVYARAYLGWVGCLTALLLTLALSVSLKGEAEKSIALAVDLAQPAILFCGTLGAVLIFFYAGAALQSAGRGARNATVEVERQLRGLARERGVVKVPEDYTPSYRGSIEVASSASLHALLPPVAVAVLCPPALGIGLSLAYRASQPGLATQGLALFATVAAASGLCTALCFDRTRASFEAARRMAKPETPASFDATLSSHALAGFLGSSAGASAQFVAKAATLGCLVVAPFLS